MAQVFYRKKFSDYLGEQRAIDDIVQFFQPDGGITPTPTPVPVTPTPTPTKTSTATPTPSITPSVTSTLTPTPTNTGTPTPTPTRTPAPACDITYTELPSPTPSPTPTITPTNTGTPTPTPTASAGPAFDPDAAAYLSAVITAGGTVTSPMSAATNNMFLALKSNSLYSKMKAFYPVLGGIAASNKINGNLNTSFDLTFNGTFTHSYSGFSSTSAASYAATNYVPITEHPGGNMNMGCFTNTTASANDRYVMAVYETGAKAVGWGYGVTTIDGYFTAYGGGLSTTPSSFIGFIQVGGDASTRYLSQNINGVNTDISAARNGSGLPNLQIYLSNLNFIGNPYSLQAGRVAFAYMSDYLTTAETTTLSSIINAFQTSLGRNYF